MRKIKYNWSEQYCLFPESFPESFPQLPQPPIHKRLTFNPKTQKDNYDFDMLQAEWHKTKKQETLGKMYFVVRRVQERFVNTYLKQKNIEMDSDRREDRIETATMFVIEKYLKDSDFFIQTLTAYARFGFTKAMFDRKVKAYEMNEVPYGDTSFIS